MNTEVIFKKLGITWVLVLVAFSIKLVYGWILYSPANIVNDALDYLEFAQLILRDGPFVPNQDEIEAFAPPGFPWLLAFSIWITGSIKGIVVFNAIFSALTVGIIYQIGKRFLPGKWSLLPALWALVYFPYTMYIDEVLKESLLQMMVPLSVLLILRLKSNVTWGRIAVFSLIITYLFHSDERFFLLVPFYLLYLVFPHEGWKAWRVPIFVVFTVMLICAPWFYRNYQVYDRPVFLTERFQSPFDEFLGYKNNRLTLRSENYQEQLTLFRDSIQAGYAPKAKSGRQRNVQEAMAQGKYPHNFNIGERVYHNTVAYWTPVRTQGSLIDNGWKYKGPRSFMVNLFYSLNYGVLLPFMILGIIWCIRKREWGMIFMTTLLFTHYMMHVLIIFGSGRYRHPVDFIIMILAFYGACHTSRWFEKRTGKSITPMWLKS